MAWCLTVACLFSVAAVSGFNLNRNDRINSWDPQLALADKRKKHLIIMCPALIAGETYTAILKFITANGTQTIPYVNKAKTVRFENYEFTYNR